MAHRTDKAVEVFTALHMNKIKDSEVEVREARAVMKELATDPNPQNKYEIGQLLAFVVNDIINQSTAYVDLFADVQRVGLGEKASFKIRKKGIQAYLGAKNGTTSRSRILNAYQDVDTIEVSARPYVNLYELASGKVNFDECVADASYKMECKMIQEIEATLYAAFSGYSTPNYASGSGIVPSTLDPMIRAFQRLGNVSLLGDIAVVSKLADYTGLTTVGTTRQFSEDVLNEANKSGLIGMYKGANVIKFANPFQDGSLVSTYLKQDLLYIVPSGVDKPLKVVFEGDVQSADQTNIDDNTMEIQLRKLFGSAVVFGANPYLGVYEDETL